MTLAAVLPPSGRGYVCPGGEHLLPNESFCGMIVEEGTLSLSLSLSAPR